MISSGRMRRTNRADEHIQTQNPAGGMCKSKLQRGMMTDHRANDSDSVREHVM